jgi:hypothetical protein
MKNKKCVILGGGFSIRENLWNTDINDLPLWKNIWNEFTIGTNWCFRWFIPTVLMYADYQFYGTEKKQLKHVPLILGKKDGAYLRKDGIRIDNNVLLLKECERKSKLIYGEKVKGLHAHYWGKEAWTKGFYSSQLIGIKALNLAIALNYDEIYLLGFDACGDEKNRTHFYSDTEVGTYEWNNQKQSGVGKDKRGYYRTGNYNKLKALNNIWFQPFEEELQKGIKIYNVSLNSKIDTFPKISYKNFYERLNINARVVNHEAIRQEIRQKLNM